MDFEVEEYRHGRLVIAGTIDQSSSRYHIRIRFGDVFALSLPFEWSTDTKTTVLQVLDGEAARRVHLQFRVEVGHTVFAFSPESLPAAGGCLVVARSIEWWRPSAEEDAANRPKAV